MRRSLNRPRPDPGILESDSGLSEASKASGDVSGFSETTALAGIQRRKRARRELFLREVIFVTQRMICEPTA